MCHVHLYLWGSPLLCGVEILPAAEASSRELAASLALQLMNTESIRENSERPPELMTAPVALPLAMPRSCDAASSGSAKSTSSHHCQS